MASAGPLLRAAQLNVDLPLEVVVKLPPPPVFLAECARFFRRGVLVRTRPFGPEPHLRIALVQVLVERAIGGESLQQIAFAFQKRLELPRARRALPPLSQEPGEQQLQEPQLQRAYPLVLHERRAAQRFDLGRNLRRLAQSERPAVADRK